MPTTDRLGGTAAVICLTAAPALAQDDAGSAVGAGVGLVLGIVITILIGAVVGWLAGVIVGGSGTGFWGDVAFGIGGSILAGQVLPLLGIGIPGPFGAFIAALLGAIALILIVRLLRRSAA
jgi:uncharacterized membrane protein YeaQ/YmgE (transglycosylase-associated protein family)